MSGGAVALLIGAVAACFWPGVAMYDTVAEYGQVLGGPVDDWHPPIMVRLWQVLHPLAQGTAPMFVAQIVLYALGFGLIVAALVRNGRAGTAVATAFLAMSPLLLGWQTVVLKDTQMLGALLGAFGIVAHYRLAQRRIPAPVVTILVMLLAYATLVRANAFFATVPLAVLLLPGRRRPALSIALAIGSVGMIVALTPSINQRLLGAEPSNVAKSQPIFDLAAIAVASSAGAGPFTPEEGQQMAARHCVKAFFWDPLGDPTGCSAVTARAMSAPAGQLYLQLAREAARHPIAYMRHRLRHWNSTERWLVPAGLPNAAPPVEAEPNDLRLTTPTNPLAATWKEIAAAEAATPFGWPIVWTLVALALLPAALRRRGDPAGGLALALAASALILEFSFLAISIASDLRYHLWPMCASALALMLLGANVQLKRPEWIAAAAGLTLVIAGGLITRSTVPRAPDSYEGMIHAASG